MRTEIKTAIENDSLILFVGAGMSMNLGFPNWNNLIKKILEQLKENHSENFPMNLLYYINALNNNSKSVFEILEEVERHGYKKEAKSILYQLFVDVTFKEEDLINQKKIWQICDKIITTNYDKAIDKVLPSNIEVFSNDNAFQQIKSIQGKPFLYKIHGDITNPDTCILFKSDYEDLYTGDSPNAQTLKNFIQNKTLLFIGFSLEDPFITSQIQYLYNLYKGYGNQHFIVSTNEKDFSKYHVETCLVDNWNEGFTEFLNELIEIKTNSKKIISLPNSPKTNEEIDIKTIDDINVLDNIIQEKLSDLSNQKGDDERKTNKELLKLRDRIVEIQMKKYDLDFQQVMPNLNQDELEHLFETIFNSPKLDKLTIFKINEVRNQNDNSGKYHWYHRSVIVSALACSLINHKELDPIKIDLLIDFANDSEKRVWQKAITYLFIILNHLGNKWLRFDAVKTKLKRLKDHSEIQEALKNIIQIMQFEFQNSIVLDSSIFENAYFKNPFNFFMPFYEKNPSIEKLYDNEKIENVEELIEQLYSLPLPDSVKYLICNNNKFVHNETSSNEDKNEEEQQEMIYILKVSRVFEPYLNDINEILCFYKNIPFNQVTLNEKLSTISVKNINDHLLNAVEQHRTIARQYALDKNWTVAITKYDSLLKLVPDDVEGLMELAQCYDNAKKDVNERIKIRKRIENLYPNIFSNLMQIVHLYENLEKYTESIIYIDKCISLRPNDYGLYNDKGVLLEEMEKYNLAIIEYNHSIKLNPNAYHLYNNRAGAKNELKDYFGAIQDCILSIKIESNNDKAFYNRSCAKFELNNEAEALDDINIAISLNSEKITYYQRRSEIRIKAKDYNGALNDCNKIIQIDNKEALGYGCKANVLKFFNDFEKAHYYIDKAIKMEPHTGEFYGTKGVIYEYEGEEDKFYEYLELAFIKKAKASSLFDEIKEKYRNETQFIALLKKYNLSLEDD